MKNIHVLPTEKLSRLGYLTKKGKEVFNDLRLFNKPMPNILDSENQNIYITSDDEIKEGDCWIYICPINGLDYGDNGNPIVKNNLPNSWFKKLHDRLNYKKIILTTDQDLIADGVQAIDDEFLQWFVENPSCESVEVNFNYKKFRWSELNKSQCYKIIIPQEEPKQETLEERIQYIAFLHKQNLNGRETEDELFEAGILAGIEETKERMYSEEEVIELLTARCKHFGTTMTPFRKLLLKQDLEWFEENKKK
jgi:hypothetical protein